jgi:hypothetical protein
MGAQSLDWLSMTLVVAGLLVFGAGVYVAFGLAALLAFGGALLTAIGLLTAIATENRQGRQ